ncbi:hypothetical protein GCM10027271_29490 [Saccharopolyspora gloriosae]|uniref:Cell division protein FtsI (Penicillin-binding protein 3) n=1 Tax=Saccharopolyspora gloriosae TaxID=455344 RepID=A0A840NMH5_9PSEU|nr:hypothetical protein [Saccharopolyspora gloriosae]MBB5071215.1 cell division protein FtsI (penicillin-binding protein 3) [Saccharopolyspora gloriosae]
MTAPARAKKPAARTGTAEKKDPAKRSNSATKSKTTTTRAAKNQATKTQPAKKAQPQKKSQTSKARTRSATAERAYARREERRDRSARETVERRPRRQRQAAEQRQPRQWRLAAVRPRARQLQAKVATSRAPLVVAVMGLLGVGLVATLSLSIAAVGGSYRLQQAEQEVTALNEHREQLLREVSNLDSTPALERKATELGMVAPPGPPAHLVTHPDGSVHVIGEPQAATGPATPPKPVEQNPTPGAQDPAPQRQAALIPAVEGD